MAEDGKELSADEKAALEMEAMLNAGPGDAGAGAAAGQDAAALGKALSQNEIDNLLGFGGPGGQKKTGIQLLLDKSTLSYERLPMLEVVFDRYVRTLSTTLRNFTSENVDVSIDSITSMRFEDYINTVPLPALLTVFQAVEWENFGLINIDSSLTYSMVDVLLGGGHAKRPLRVEGRPYTTIEQDIIKSVIGLMLEDMCSAFNALTPATFRFERLENNPRFATITRPINPIILATLRIDMDDRGGKVEIVLPYATLEPIKELLLQMFTGEKFGRDTMWHTHLSKEVLNTQVEVDVVLENKVMLLKDVANLRIGTTIIMDKSPDDEVTIRCKGVDMMSASVGCVGDKVAVKVLDILIKKDEMEEA